MRVVMDVVSGGPCVRRNGVRNCVGAAEPDALARLGPIPRLRVGLRKKRPHGNAPVSDLSPQTTSTSPPSELAANRLGGELCERKSHRPRHLRFRNKLAAK